MSIHYAKFEYKGMKIVARLQITQTRHPKRISDGNKCLSLTALKCENIYQICTQKEVHIFNLWTIIIQNLNVKEQKLLKLQITQTRHTKSISDGKMSKFNTCTIVKLLIKCSQKRRCTSSIYSYDSYLGYRLHKPDAPYAFRMEKCLSSTPVKM